ncbi:hypothetical protein BH11ARM1_BH11ARM1_02740 [soil metagenome]
MTIIRPFLWWAALVFFAQSHEIAKWELVVSVALSIPLFILYGIDKSAAKRNRSRIPEATDYPRAMESVEKLAALPEINAIITYHEGPVTEDPLGELRRVAENSTRVPNQSIYPQLCDCAATP